VEKFIQAPNVVTSFALGVPDNQWTDLISNTKHPTESEALASATSALETAGVPASVSVEFARNMFLTAEAAEQ